MNNTSSVNTSILTSLLVFTLAFIVSLGSISSAYAGNGLFQYQPASQDSSAKLVKGVVKTIFIVAAIQGGKKHLQKYLVKKAANDPRFKQGLIKQIKGFIKSNPKYKKKALALLAAIIGASAAKELSDDSDSSQLSELEDRQYRTFLANGGDTSVEDWRALGKPDAPAQVASKSRFNRFKDKFKAKVNSTAKRLKAKIDKRTNINNTVAPDSLNKAGSDLPILNLQSSNSVVTQSVEALAKARGDVVIKTEQLSVLQKGDTLTIVAHGSPIKAGGMRADELASLLTQNNLTAGTIELVACKTGCSIFAQQLANLTGAKVIAPTANINVLSDIHGVPQVRDPITGILRPPGELIETFEPIKP